MAYPVSDRWIKFIRRGFRAVTYCDVQFPGEGIVFADLPVSGGSISVSRKNSYRSSGNIQVADPTLFPTLNSDSPIQPYGAEIIIRTGIRYPEGNEELVPMGVFPIEEVTGSEAGGNISNISFYDRAKRVEAADFIAPKDYGGELVLDVIESEVLYAAPFYPGSGVEWQVHFDESLENIALPQGTILEDNRWAFVTELAESIGADIFFGRDGDVYVAPVPGIFADGESPEEDWLVDAGDNGILIDATRGASRTDVFNGVVVVGSADGDRPQPFALVTDDNPDSRTFFGGPFGKSIKRIDNSKLTNNDACERQARAELRNITGLQRSVSFEQVGNPATDPGDISRLRFLDGSEEIHMLDGYEYDFFSAKLSADTRSIQFIPPES